jgi:Flp pilus assembly protein TadG
MAGTMGNNRRSREGQDGESGQVLVLFAIAIAAIVAMLVLVIDLGVLLSQRRFDQNGADAAVLAVGRRLAASTAASDTTLYQRVRYYAGLNPADASTGSTGVNQIFGLKSRTNVVVTLEYSTIPGQWCHSPASLAQEPALDPPRSPPTTACTLSLGTLPPLPVANHPYRVRVTASATTDGFFARSIGLGDPPPPASCLRPAGAPGITTCAQAVVTIQTTAGGAEYAVFALEDCALSNTGIFVGGSNVTITGGAHTDSNFGVPGSNIYFNGATTSSCVPSNDSITGSNIRVNGAAFSSDTATFDSPLGYTLADFPCTHWALGPLLVPQYANGLIGLNYTIGGSNLPLAPGVYCANGDITVSGSNIYGQVTFVATGKVIFSGSNLGFTPRRDNVQAFSTYDVIGGDAVIINGSNITVQGVIYTPHADTLISGSNYSAFNMAIVAKRVRLTGSNLSINGTGQGVRDGRPTVSLTE